MLIIVDSITYKRQVDRHAKIYRQSCNDKWIVMSTVMHILVDSHTKVVKTDMH